MDDRRWKEIYREIDELCSLHDEATDSEKCRAFANRLSLFMSELEDEGCDHFANMVMDALAYCNPKTASHCETAQSEKGRLERIRAEVGKKLKRSG